MTITLSALQKQRRDTAANWTAENPTLLAGEIGLESDTGYWKVGDGSTAWTSLAYVPALGAKVGVPDGTAAAPAVFFADDTNTGLYSPGADQVAISTGGTGRLFVDVNGRILSSSTSSSTKDTLVLQGNSSFLTGEPIIRLRRNAASVFSGTDLGAISFENQENQGALIQAYGDGTWTFGSSHPTSLRFATTPASGTSAVERLRITSTGQLSHIGGGSAVSPAVGFNGSAPSNSMVLDSSGRLGLGTSLPTGKLDIQNGANRAIKFEVDSTSGDNHIKSFQGPSENVRNLRVTAEQFTLATNSFSNNNGIDRITVLTNGSVGVGTTSPAAKLETHVTSDGAESARFRISGLTNNPMLRIIHHESEGHEIQANGSNLSAAAIKYTIGANERARIDGAGRLLVGTPTSTADTRCVFQGRSGNTSGASNIHISAGYTTAASGTLLGAINYSDSSQNIGAKVEATIDGTWTAGSSYPTRLVFSTTADGASSPTERMRITNYGGTLLNTISASINTTNFGTAVGCNSSAAAVIGLLRTARNGDGTVPVFESYGNVGQFRTLGDGDAENTNNSYAGISDVRLKENIIAAGSQWDDLKALQVRKYNFKAETGYNTHTQIGLIAQEVELISPGLVGESIDEETGESTKSVNYSVLYMKAVKALQEAMERIETLEASNTDLLARVSALESA